MNEKIAQLAKQANLPSWATDDTATVNIADRLEKFAELLLEESIQVMMQNDYHGEWLGEKIKEHFNIPKQ